MAEVCVLLFPSQLCLSCKNGKTKAVVQMIENDNIENIFYEISELSNFFGFKTEILKTSKMHTIMM